MTAGDVWKFCDSIETPGLDIDLRIIEFLCEYGKDLFRSRLVKLNLVVKMIE